MDLVIAISTGVTALILVIGEWRRWRKRRTADVRARLEYRTATTGVQSLRSSYYLVIHNAGPATAVDVAPTLTKANTSGGRTDAWPSPIGSRTLEPGNKWVYDLATMPVDWEEPRVVLQWRDRSRKPRQREEPLDVTMYGRSE